MASLDDRKRRKANYARLRFRIGRWATDARQPSDSAGHLLLVVGNHAQAKEAGV
jgi:hypothetical protein